MPLTPGPLQVPPAGVELSITMVSVKHTLGSTLINTIFGNGLTVMVNVLVGPVQVMPPLVKLGVTVMVAVTGLMVGLMAIKLGILPMPDAPSPILVLLFVQV